MDNDIIARLREFLENETKSCSMDFGYITLNTCIAGWLCADKKDRRSIG